MIQSDLAKIGIDAKLVTYEWGEYRKRSQNGEFTTAQGGWTGDNGDPDIFFFLRSCSAARIPGLNSTGWCNKEFEDMLVKARQTTDVKARTELYKKMQVIEKEEAPELTIAHSVVFEAMRSNVEGYKVSPLGAHVFYGVDLK
jgi:dipeptide transport system substrate-binding protein